MKQLLKKLIRKVRAKGGRQTPVIPNIPDAELYNPLFSPWLGYGEFRSLYEKCRDYTLVSPDRCHVLYSLAKQAMRLDGDFFECGVYKGGTAILLAELLAAKGTAGIRLHLFDTFEGMPETDAKIDLHRLWDFADTDIDSVRARVGRQDLVELHQGFIPATFSGMENARIAFAHIDVDIYQSVLDCCSFVMPRLVAGGFVIFDDYGFPSCPGARKAVDDFLRTVQRRPLSCLPVRQWSSR